MTRKSSRRPQHPLRTFVLDSEALSQAVRGHRKMMARLELAARGGFEVVTSPMTLIEAYDGSTTEQRWDWILSKLTVADLGKNEARQARRILAAAGLHGHKYAIDAALAVIATQQRGDVTIFTSDVDDLQKLTPDTVVVIEV